MSLKHYNTNGLNPSQFFDSDFYFSPSLSTSLRSNKSWQFRDKEIRSNVVTVLWMTVSKCQDIFLALSIWLINGCCLCFSSGFIYSQPLSLSIHIEWVLLNQIDYMKHLSISNLIYWFKLNWSWGVSKRCLNQTLIAFILWGS